MGENESRGRRLAQYASGAAVVISLVFVGLEVRETARQTELNTEALRVAAYQDLVAQIARLNELLLDPELAVLYNRINDPTTTWATLDALEASRATRILFLLARHADMAYYQFQQGLLPEERLNSALNPFLGSIQAPVYREFWQRYKNVFVTSFSEFIDSRLAVD